MPCDPHEDCRAELEELTEQVAALREQLGADLRGKADDADVDSLRSDLQLAGEGLQRTWAVLDDMINHLRTVATLTEDQAEEFTDDLARLEELGELLG